MELEDAWAIEDTRMESETPLLAGMRNGDNELGYDEESRTFYCTIGMEDDVEVNSAYSITPTTWDILPENAMPQELLPLDYRHHGGFSIYGDFANATYDLAFLEYLN